MGKVKFALLGSIPKGDEARENFVDWKTEYIKAISSAIPNAIFLNGDLISDSVGSELVVGHDLWMIKNADIIIVNAPAKIGAGTAQEMVLAKYFKKPVISVVPKNSHHRRSNVVFHGVEIVDWVHPFIDVSSDFIAEDIDQAIGWIEEYLSTPSKTKDITVFDQAIDNFETKSPDIISSYRADGWG